MERSTFEKHSISISMAKLMIDLSENKAAEMGIRVVTVIVDECGQLKAFSRMDNAPLLSLNLAIDKAWSGSSFPRPTHKWYENIKDDPSSLISVPLIRGLTTSGGGYPLKINKSIVGGIGVSGGTTDEDMECAEYAISFFEKSNL